MNSDRLLASEHSHLWKQRGVVDRDRRLHAQSLVTSEVLMPSLIHWRFIIEGGSMPSCFIRRFNPFFGFPDQVHNGEGKVQMEL